MLASDVRRCGLMALPVLVALLSSSPAADAQENGEENRLVDFKFESLRMISPKISSGGAVYWYMLYTLENPSDEDREIFLSINATSDRKKTYSDLFLPLVEQAIERREGTPLWGQTDRYEILSKRDPEDRKFNYTTIKAREKRRCVAVFNSLDPNVSHVAIRVSGLYPVETESGQAGRQILERVRVLEFRRAGDNREVSTNSHFQLIDRSWTKVPVREKQ